MPSRTNILMLVLAILAFLPVIAVDRVMDGYVRGQETAKLQAAVDALTQDSQHAVRGAIASLRAILVDSPSLCTTTFYQNVFNALQQNLHLRQVVVENRDGVQYCAGFGGEVRYAALSESLAIPGYTESLTAVSLDLVDGPVFKITQAFGRDRTVSVFMTAAPLLAGGPVPSFDGLAYLRLALTNGAPLAAEGAGDAAVARMGEDLIVAHSFAGEVPLRAEAGVRFSEVKVGYAPLYLAFTLMTCAIAIMQLLMTLGYVRRAKLPAFDLERAIAAGELKPYYQPVFNLHTGRLIGCEVLIRWVKRGGKVVSPGAFIDYAELTGLAIPMTLNLMEQVRNDLEDLCRGAPDFKVSINLFEGHFRDAAVVEDIQSIFGGSGIRYRQLVFEITERQPLDDRSAVNRIVTAMHALGVRIAMDDAGTGHSNLAYLHTLGIDIIKIDKIFVDMIKDANAPVPVVDGLIAMARDMKIDVVAEGVETAEQAVYLRARGVEAAQGYLFSPAIRAEAFLKLAHALREERFERAEPARSLPAQAA